MPAEHRFVVTGTDTEVGKTVVGAGLARAWADARLTVVAVKPVESGCDGGHVEDGVCLATADLKFVGASYAVSGVVFPALVGLAGPNALRGVWNAFVVFQIARAAVLQLRARHVLRKY